MLSCIDTFIPLSCYVDLLEGFSFPLDQRALQQISRLRRNACSEHSHSSKVRSLLQQLAHHACATINHVKSTRNRYRAVSGKLVVVF